MSQEKNSWDKLGVPNVSLDVATRAWEKLSKQPENDVEWLSESIEHDSAELNEQKVRLEKNKELSKTLGKVAATFFVAGLGGVLVGYAPFVEGLNVLTFEDLNDFSKVLALGGEFAIVGGCVVELVKEGVDHVGGKIKDAMKKISDSIKTAEFKKEQVSFKEELKNIPAAAGKYEKPGQEEIHSAVNADAFPKDEMTFEDTAKVAAQRQYAKSVAEEIIKAGLVDNNGNPWIPEVSEESAVEDSTNVGVVTASPYDEAVATEDITKAPYVKPELKITEEVPPSFFNSPEN